MGTDLYGQGDFAIRLDWGPAGARAMLSSITVVVDVLSFSTAVTIAVERGMTVIPYSWTGPFAAEYAASKGAVLAVGRLEAGTFNGPRPPSLSPYGLLTCDLVPRIVLPSPNGSTICAQLQESGSQVMIGSLRNSRAVAATVAGAVRAGRSVGVVAAGERWADDQSLRPCLEDHLGAGAILSHLRTLGVTEQASPEALAAADVFDRHRGDLGAVLSQCVGGRELTAKGFSADIGVAAQLDVSQTVPLLVKGELIAG